MCVCVFFFFLLPPRSIVSSNFSPISRCYFYAHGRTSGCAHAWCMHARTHQANKHRCTYPSAQVKGSCLINTLTAFSLPGLEQDKIITCYPLALSPMAHATTWASSINSLPWLPHGWKMIVDTTPPAPKPSLENYGINNWKASLPLCHSQHCNWTPHRIFSSTLNLKDSFLQGHTLASGPISMRQRNAENTLILFMMWLRSISFAVILKLLILHIFSARFSLTF